MASRPVRRILYLTLRPSDGHPSRLTVTRPLLRPTRGSNGRAAHPLCSALLRMGFVEPPRSPPALVRSYRTVSPLPVRAPNPWAQGPPSAVCSLWHFPASRPDWVLPSTLPCGVRTFLGRVPCGPGRGHPAGSPPIPFWPTALHRVPRPSIGAPRCRSPLPPRHCPPDRSTRPDPGPIVRGTGRGDAPAHTGRVCPDEIGNEVARGRPL